MAAIGCGHGTDDLYADFGDDRNVVRGKVLVPKKHVFSPLGDFSVGFFVAYEQHTPCFRRGFDRVLTIVNTNFRGGQNKFNSSSFAASLVARDVIDSHFP